MRVKLPLRNRKSWALVVAVTLFQFRIGSRLVKGDDLTTFFGGPAQSLALLKDGVRVEVKGQQRRGDVQTLDALQVGQTLHVIGVRQSDGSIDARRIQIDDDETGGEFEIERVLGGLKLPGAGEPGQALKRLAD